MEVHQMVKYWRYWERHLDVFVQEIYGIRLSPWQKLYVSTTYRIERVVRRLRRVK